MTVTDLTVPAQDYLKMIWSATEWSPTPVTIGNMAERTGVTPATVSDGVKRLARQGLVSHAPYGSIELTETGREHAVAMVRRHRLLETFLVEILGYGWDEVHDEAEVLEHAVSDTMIERIDKRLGHPARDPHGDPIPTADGHSHLPPAVQLTATTPGQEVTILRISDASPDMLRYFAQLGLRPDIRLTIVEQRPYAAVTTVRPDSDSRDLDLGSAAAAAIWVSNG